jgi:hypothetical protein
MLKPTILNILLFWFVKYIAFYVLLMFKNSNYTLLKVNEIKTGGDLFYYLWLFLFLPVVCMLVFSAPMYFSFKVKSLVYFALIIAAILIVEYLFYTWSASQANLMNGVYNGIISILFLLLFFFRYISAIYQQQSI